MIPGEDKAEVSLSSEFFKKLNQQIVQKDNLIKLLQLQIKNLKSQLEETTAEGQKKEDISKALEAKEEEIRRLQSELEAQKAQFISFSKEKDEQIAALNRIIEEYKQAQVSPQVIAIDESAVTELKTKIENLEAELIAERKAKEELIKAKADFERQIADLSIVVKDAQDLQIRLETALQENIQLATKLRELEPLQDEVAQLKNKLVEADAKLIAQSTIKIDTDELTGKVAELEQDIANLRNLLDEKEREVAALKEVKTAVDPVIVRELEDAKNTIQALQMQISELETHAKRAKELELTLADYSEKLRQAEHLKEKLQFLEERSKKDDEALQEEVRKYSEATLKIATLENELAKLNVELQDSKKTVDCLLTENSALKAEIEKHKITLSERDREIQALQEKLDVLRNTDIAGEATRAEIEQLTNQVADQLLAIQKLEELVRANQEKLAEKDQEIKILQEKLAKVDSSPSQVIHIDSDSEIIASFIDFFDGLDAYLSQNPNSELQSLHRKLLERLILPNQIQYMPVISETFDPSKHIATDYFRSDKFGEKCIVFEVEKGYSRGDLVVKKAKVWVVQNLFECRGCGTMQSNIESRFCHMCGQKILAPNGLPVDSLPVFEPTATTYLRFAERMIEKGELAKAREYLNEGLKLDPNSVQVLSKLSDVLALNSEFEEAIACLQKAALIKPDAKIAEKIKALEIRNSIYQQARSLNLPPEEFEKLINLIQKK